MTGPGGTPFGRWYVRRGRLGRRAWWLHHVLPLTVVLAAALSVDAALGFPGFVEHAAAGETRYVGPFGVVTALSSLPPVVSAAVARLHDRGHSAWWLLWYLVPVVGWIVLLVPIGLLPGYEGPNEYGPAPGRTTAPVAG